MNQLTAQGRVLFDFEIGNKTIWWETDGLMSSLLQSRVAQRINTVLFIGLILKWEYLCIVVEREIGIYSGDFCGLRTGFLLACFTMGGSHEKPDKISSGLRWITFSKYYYALLITRFY